MSGEGITITKIHRSTTSPDCLTLAVTQPFSLLPKGPVPAVDHTICVPPSVTLGPLVNLPSLIDDTRSEKVVPDGAVACSFITASAFWVSCDHPKLGIKWKLVFTYNTTKDTLKVTGFAKVWNVLHQKWEDPEYDNDQYILDI